MVDKIVPPPLRGHPYLFWISSFCLVVGATTIFEWHKQLPRAFFYFCVLYALGFLTVPLAFRACYVKLKTWGSSAETFIFPANRNSTINEWLEKELLYVNGSMQMYLVSLVITIFACIVVLYGDYPTGLRDGPGIFALSVQVVSSFVASLGLYSIFCFCRTIWRLGEFQIRVKPHKFGILSTWRMLGHCFFIMALVWSTYCTIAILGFKNLHLTKSLTELAMLPPILILVLPTVIGMFVGFIVCQIPLHRKMVEFKHNELAKVDQLIDVLTPRRANDATPEVREKIKFFENRREELNYLPEWPFDLKTLLGAFGSSIMLTLPALISSLVTVAAKAALQ